MREMQHANSCSLLAVLFVSLAASERLASLRQATASASATCKEDDPADLAPDWRSALQYVNQLTQHRTTVLMRARCTALPVSSSSWLWFEATKVHKMHKNKHEHDRLMLFVLTAALAITGSAASCILKDRRSRLKDVKSLLFAQKAKCANKHEDGRNEQEEESSRQVFAKTVSLYLHLHLHLCS